MTGIWSRFTKVDWQCENPVLPRGQSGLKVIVATFADLGSKDMLAALRQLGIDNVYSSEAFRLFVWDGISSKYWLDQVGGDWHRMPCPGNPIAPDREYDFEVLKRTPAHDMAASVSRCRIGALSVDGMALATHKILQASPGAKVITLSWRSQWRMKVLQTRATLNQLLWLPLFSVIFGAPSALPWNALLPAIDRHFGGRAAEKFMKMGRADFGGVGQDPWTLTLFLGATFYSRIMSPMFHGSAYTASSEGDYAAYFAGIRAIWPSEDHMDVDFRNQTYEDVCGFLGISPCPQTGHIPPGLGDEETRWAPYAPFVVVALVVHWLNWKILGLMLAPLRCCCTQRAAAKDKTE